MRARRNFTRLRAGIVLVGLTAGVITVIGDESVEAATLPPGFVEEVVATDGLQSVTAFDFLPDGRIVLAEKRGRIKVFDATDITQSVTVLNIQDLVNTAGDRGLIAFAVDPDFATNERIYVGYSYDPPETADAATYWDGLDSTTRSLANGQPNGGGQRTTRITSYQLDATDNYESIVDGSEVILVGEESTWSNIGDPFAHQNNFDVPWACMSYDVGELPHEGTPIDDCIPTDGLSHQIGTLAFGPDGYLYASMGDAGSWGDVDQKALRALDINHLAGKVIRINPDTGTAVTGNPYYEGDGTSNQSMVWASGLRQPFRLTFDSAGTAYIGDVGWNSYEEINEATAGDSFGWPCFEGGLTDAEIDAGVTEGAGTTVAQPGYTALPGCDAYPASGEIAPARAWCHYPVNPGVCQTDNIGLSSIAGVVYEGGTYPSEYEGLWYGDIVGGWVSVLDLNTGEVTPVSQDLIVPVDFKIGPDGDIYYAARIIDQIIAIRYEGGDNQQPTAVATSDVEAGGTPLAVNFDGSGSSDDDGTVVEWDWDFGDGNSDSGETVSHTYTADGEFDAVLTVTDDEGGTDTATITITSGNEPPVPVISSPTADLVVDLETTLNFSGSATDPEDGPLADPMLTWSGIQHHNDHIHEDAYEGMGSNPVPYVFEDHADDTYFEICLTATDLEGLSATTCVNVFPTEIDYTFETVPAGLDVVYAGQQLTTPITITVPAGVNRTIDAPEPQGGQFWSEWSIGGPKNQTITTASDDTTVTATFVNAANDPKLVFGTATAVGDDWQTITLPDTYSDAVVVATPRYQYNVRGVVTRIRNVTATSFDLRVQVPSGATAPATDVEYIVGDSGIYTEAENGVDLEIGTMTSTVTDNASSWAGQEISLTSSFAAPIVVGQVMSANDPQWSQFWANGGNQWIYPIATNVSVGKHVGEDSSQARADETIGYMVFEAGTWTVDGTDVAAGRTATIVAGEDNAMPHAEALPFWSSTGVLSQAGMRGGDGSWPVLLETEAEFGDELDMMVDEDTISGSERWHSLEQVAWVVAAGTNLPLLSAGEAAAQEGDGGSYTMKLPVTLSRTSLVDVTFDYATTGPFEPWIATEGVDYTATSGTITIPAGERIAHIEVEVFADDELERPTPYYISPDVEWVAVALTNVSNATLDTGTVSAGLGYIRIIDDE